ncbi:MAG: DMT family transporter [Chloroflexota bacterium]
MKLSKQNGIYLALVTATISGVSIYLNKFAVQAVPDAVLLTTLKNTVVGLALVGYLILTGRRAWRSGSSGKRTTWMGLAALSVLGGSLPFLLFFQGLASAAAPSAALVHKSLFLWVALLAIPLLGERPGRWTLAGLALLTLGQLLNGWPLGWGWSSGETLILLATWLWAAETILARLLLPAVPTGVAAAARMAGGAVLMWLYLVASGQAGRVVTLSFVQWGWVLLTSAFLLGYVTTWYAALKRAPATIVTSALTLGAVVTVILGRLNDGLTLGADRLLGLALMVAGVALVIHLRGDRRPRVRPAAA